MSTATKDLNEVVARHLQASRGDVSAERVALEANELGIRWSRSTIADLENGRRKFSAIELLALPLILSASTGRHVRLADLIAEDIRVTDKLSLSVADIGRILHGEPVVLDGYESLAEREARAILERYEQARKPKTLRKRKGAS